MFFRRSAERTAAIDERAHHAATSPQNDREEPSRAQQQAGNYKHGHVQVQGLRIAIENPVGSVRSGVTAEGKIWRTVLQNHYGRLKGTEGADGDQVDVFIGPHPESELVFVIDQVIGGKFDEHKVVVGALSEAEARAIYRANYQRGWQGLGAITALPIAEFKQWLAHHDTSVPMATNRLAPWLMFLKAKVRGHWRVDSRTKRRVWVGPHERADPLAGAQFVSPNTAQGLTVRQAVRRRTANEQQALRSVAEAVDRQFGIKSQHRDALGDWSHGIENSFFVPVTGSVSWTDLAASAAMKSKAAQQYAAVVVKRERGAAGVLYQLTVDGLTLGELRSVLDRHEVTHRTIESVESRRWTVTVASVDHAADERMLGLGAEVNSDVRRWEARVEVIGDPEGASLERAFADYDRRIAAAEGVQGQVHRHDRRSGDDGGAAPGRGRPRRPLLKALLGLGRAVIFKTADQVLRPGSRGGRWYVDHAGHIRYGVPPEGVKPFAGASSARQVAQVTSKKSGLFAGRAVRSTADTAEIFREIVDHDRERFWMLHLGSSHRPIAVECISQGSLTASIVTMRETFKNALALGTKRVAFVHNHPSEDPRPSPEDVEITRMLRGAAAHIGIDVSHHVVVGGHGYADVENPVPVAWGPAPTDKRRQLRHVEGTIKRGAYDSPWPGLFGSPVRGSGNVAAIGRILFDPGDRLAAVLMLDSKHNTVGVYPLAHESIDLGFSDRLATIAAGSNAISFVLVASADGPQWRQALDAAHDVAGRIASKVGVRHLDTVAVGAGGAFHSITDSGQPVSGARL